MLTLDCVQDGVDEAIVSILLRLSRICKPLTLFNQFWIRTKVFSFLFTVCNFNRFTIMAKLIF